MPALYRWISVSLVLGFLIRGSGAEASLPLVVQEPQVQLLADGLQITWAFPEAKLTLNPDGTTSIDMPSLQNLDQPGFPALPVVYHLVALPPGAQPELAILSLTETTEDSPGNLSLGGNTESMASGDGDVSEIFAPPLLHHPHKLPPAEFEYLGVMRGIQLGRIILYPVREIGDYLQITEDIRLQLDFQSISSQNTESGILSNSDPFIAALRSQVINPDQMRSSSTLTNASGIQPLSSTSTTPVAVIPVSQKGMTQVTYSDLSSSGFPVNTVNPSYLRMEQAGQEVQFEWLVNDGDNVFESNERFLFYANPRYSRWTNIDHYYLFEDFGITQTRIQTQNANPGALLLANIEVENTFESNLKYTPEGMNGKIPPGRDGDRWAWEKIQWTSGQPVPTKSYTAILSQVDSSRSAELTIWLLGITNVLYPPAIDHQVTVGINAYTFNSKIEWNGKQAVESVLTIPSGTLVSGNNTLNLSVGALGVSPEAMWLDAFRLRYPILTGQGKNTPSIDFTGQASQSKYSVKLSSFTNPRAYDVTQPYSPKKLVNFTQDNVSLMTIGDPPGGSRHQYLATSDAGIISLPANSVRLKKSLLTGGPSYPGAQYLVISPQLFHSSLIPLVNLRTSRGLSVVVEDVQAIYDHYSDGRIDPQAIRAFLKDAYSWPVKPVYVLGVGDGTVDPKRNTTPFPYDTDLTFFPPYFDPLENVDPWYGETAADNRYVCVDGDDNLPDMAFGRLPVNSTSELAAVVNKIISFETAPPAGNWSSSFTLVADNFESNDPGNNFPSDADSLAGHIPGNFTVEKIYHDPVTDPTPPYPSKVTRPAVINAWNNGRLYIAYAGHSSTTRWATEDFFYITDITNLSNGNKTPILLELTCFTGRFHQDDQTTLDEALLRFPTGGPVATFSPTGKGLSYGHRILMEGFLDSAFDSAAVSIGMATIDGKLNLMANYLALDLIDTYVLLGDPALSPVLPGTNIAQKIYIPLIFK